jgi:hypothetical protein
MKVIANKGALCMSGLAIVIVLMCAGTLMAQPPLPGAIFTTNYACGGVNVNIFASKDDVYLDGGPAHAGAVGLPDGEYYVRVTMPDGTLLGTSVGSGDDTPVEVTGGAFISCYQLSAILIKASDSTPGYDDTGNPGGEYKVWVSMVSTFDNNSTKTDNFKLGPASGPLPQGLLTVIKFYDSNATGAFDGTDSEIEGWPVTITDGITLERTTPVAVFVDPDIYTVTECTPTETNWMHTTPNPVEDVVVTDGGTTSVEFGNLCVGGGGGLTLGFWSNKNGRALFGDDDLALMVSLNLRNADGTNFDPASYTDFRSWLLSAKATNMAYMLSAQLAAMELNVLNGKVNGDSLIYAPGTTSANPLGFATVNAVMAEADAELGLHGLTLSGSPYREYQEALKDALDKANNNITFVQPTPCVSSCTLQ